MNKLVLTGAAGRLGSYLREPLTKLCDELVSTDLTAISRSIQVSGMRQRICKTSTPSGSRLTYDDLILLVERAITTPVTGFSVDYGVSDVIALFDATTIQLQVMNGKKQHASIQSG